jgi:hypothetical protein
MDNIDSMNAPMEPVQQSAAATAPAPETSVPTPSAAPSGLASLAPAPGKSIFQNMVMGVLLGASAGSQGKNFAAGLGAGVGAVKQQADQNVEQSAKFRDEKRADLRNQASIANLQATTLKLHKDISLLPPDRQTAAIEDAAAKTDEGVKSGIYVPKSAGMDYQSAMAAWQQAHQQNPNDATTVRPVTGPDGKPQFALFDSPNAPITAPVTIQIGTDTKGQPINRTFQPDGMITKRQIATLHTSGIEQDLKTQSENQQTQFKENLPSSQAKIDLTKSETAKNYADAAKAKSDVQDKADDIQALAQQLNDPNNLTSLKSIASMRTGERLKVFAAAKKMNPNFDPGVIDQRVNFLQKYEDPNGRAANNRLAINNIFQHGADLSDINQEYRRSDVKVLNTPLNKIRDQYGQEAYTKFQTTVAVLKDELGLYFAGGYAPTKEQGETWKQILDNTATPAKVEAFTKEIGTLATRRAYTFNGQFRSVMGHDDPAMLTPEAKVAAEKLGLGKEVAKLGTGGQIGQGSPQTGVSSPLPKSAKPAGATMRVPGSDGKMHWSDGKSNLGVAE